MEGGNVLTPNDIDVLITFAHVDMEFLMGDVILTRNTSESSDELQVVSFVTPSGKQFSVTVQKDCNFAVCPREATDLPVLYRREVDLIG